MTVPKCGLASTFTHGAGVACPCAVVTTYSRPSGVNPPRPLKKIRSCRGSPGVATGSARCVLVGVNRGTRTSGRRRRWIWSHSVPRLSVRMARATACRRMRSSFGIWSAARTKMPPGRSVTFASSACGNQPHDLFVEQLPVTGVIFVPDHQVHRQSFQAPVCVGLDELAYQIDIGRVSDLQQHDRQIAGNGVAPQAGLPAAVPAENARVGAQRGIGIDYRAGKVSVELRVGLRGVELPQDHLAMGPRQIEDAIRETPILVFLDKA